MKLELPEPYQILPDFVTLKAYDDFNNPVSLATLILSLKNEELSRVEVIRVYIQQQQIEEIQDEGLRKFAVRILCEIAHCESSQEFLKPFIDSAIAKKTRIIRDQGFKFFFGLPIFLILLYEV